MSALDFTVSTPTPYSLITKEYDIVVSCCIEQRFVQKITKNLISSGILEKKTYSIRPDNPDSKTYISVIRPNKTKQYKFILFKEDDKDDYFKHASLNLIPHEEFIMKTETLNKFFKYLKSKNIDL